LKPRSTSHSRDKFLSILLLVLLIPGPVPGHISSVHAQTDPQEFGPLIVDSRFRLEPLLGAFDVQGFLEDRSIPLAGSLVPAKNRNLAKASTVINDLSLEYEIAPQVILVLMQMGSGILDATLTSPAGLDSPLGLPAGLPSGFYAQLEWVARELDTAAPRYMDAHGIQGTEVLLADGTRVEIPGGSSPTSALLKVFGVLSADARALADHARRFDSLYREYFGVDPLEFPPQLDASLSGARLPFEGTMRYTGGPHGGGSTAPCAQIPIGSGSGIDFSRNQVNDDANWEVLSILPGTLLSRDNNAPWGIGNRIRVKHSDTLVSEYWHLDSFTTAIKSLNIGDPVPQGFPVGYAGDSGDQYAIHLHLELRTPGGTPVQWNAETIDGYQIGLHKVFNDQNLGYSYQGSAVLGGTRRKQITAYCGGSGANDALVGTGYTGANEQNGLDPNTVFADTRYDSNAGRLTSTNTRNVGNDEFNDPALDPSWRWVREVPTHWSLAESPGYLRLNTQQKDISGASNDAPLLLRSLGQFQDQDFMVQTRILLTPSANSQQAGLVIYADDDNYIRLTYAFINGPVFEFAGETGGNFQPIQVPAPPGINDFHLMIARSGLNYLAYFSEDGINWKPIGTHLNLNISPNEAGLLGFNGVDGTTLEVPADFDYFRISSHGRKTARFRSQAVYDGWILESSETSDTGGTLNAVRKTFSLGDNAENRQYRAILSFDTAGLPEDAVITWAALKIKKKILVGTDPFGVLGGLKVDIRKNRFYTSQILQVEDFKAWANKKGIGAFNTVPNKKNWYTAVLDQPAWPYMNKKGLTQFRLRFAIDDNDDLVADYIKFFSGNALLAKRPKLIIKYFLP
jgi:murein DD-endopeptidase MepM/ murein hydrolase activator NlpD